MNAGAPFAFYDQVTLPAFPGDVPFDFSRLSSIAREPLMITSIILKGAPNLVSLRAPNSTPMLLVRMSIGRHPITSSVDNFVPFSVCSPVRSIQGQRAGFNFEVFLKKPLIVLPGVALSAAVRRYDAVLADGAASIAIHGNFLPHGYKIPREFWIPYISGWRNGPITAAPTSLASPEGDLHNELEEDLVCDYMAGCWAYLGSTPYHIAVAEHTRASTVWARYDKLNLCPAHTPWQIFFNSPQAAFDMNEFRLPSKHRIFVETVLQDPPGAIIPIAPGAQVYTAVGLVGRRKEAF